MGERLLRSWRTARRKSWHPTAKRLARLRAVYWTLGRGHETEICSRCGGPVGVVFSAPEPLWLAHCHTKQPPHGVLCIKCLTDLARADGVYLYWSCAASEFPECAGHPCAHQEAMITIARQRDEIWADLLKARQADPAVDSTHG
jgi:hypothetical protein